MKKIVLIIIMFLLFVSVSFASNITINSTSGFYIDYNRDSRDWIAMAGQRDVTFDGFESVAYCIEPGIPHSNGNVTLIKPIDYNAFGDAWTQQGTYNNYYNGIYAAWLMDQYSTGLGYDGYLGDKDVADVGLSIAMWYVLYNFNPNDGSFDDSYFHNITYRNNNPTYVPYVFSADISDGPNSGSYGDGNKEEAAWLLAYEYYFTFQDKYINNNLKFSGKYDFFVAEITNNGNKRQTHMIAKSSNTTHTPEPATMLLFGMGLLGIAKITRKK